MLCILLIPGACMPIPYPRYAEQKGSLSVIHDVIRLENVFRLIENHLRKIDRNELLPAGIIISGGGSGTTTINDLAKASLNLPSRVASLYFLSPNRDQVQDSTWAIACGLCLAGSTLSDDSPSLSELSKNVVNRVKRFVKQFFV